MALYSAPHTGVCGGVPFDHVILSFFPSFPLVTVTNLQEQIELPIAMQQSAKAPFNHELRSAARRTPK